MRKTYLGVAVTTFFGAWLGAAATRFLVAQSWWTLAFDGLLWALWWASLSFIPDWHSYRKVAPVVVAASLAGLALGLKFP